MSSSTSSSPSSSSPSSPSSSSLSSWSSEKSGRRTDSADASAGGRAPAPFRGPAADSALGEALLDALPLVFALGYAADASRCRALCGMTWRTGDRGATNDMIVQSLRRQCGEREVRAAKREGFLHPRRGYAIGGSTQLIRAAILNNLPRVPSSSSSARCSTLLTSA